MTFSKGSDDTNEIDILSEEEGCMAIDKLIMYEQALEQPFNENELADIFRKADSQKPVGLLEGIQFASLCPDNIARKIVDDHIHDLNESIAFQQEINAPFTGKELTELFQKHSWGSCKGSREYNALTPEEKQFVDLSGWTPSESQYSDTQTREEHRYEMKKAVKKTPFPARKINTRLLVMKHIHENKFFYFFTISSNKKFSSSRQDLDKLKKVLLEPTVDRLGPLWLEILKGTAALAEKLRPDQMKYLDTKFMETLDFFENCKVNVFDDDFFDCPPTYIYNYQLLTDDEKEKLEILDLTPRLAKSPIAKRLKLNPKEIPPMRRMLKESLVKKPFDFCPHYTVVSDPENRYFRVEGPKPYKPIIVEKAKLRADQIDFLTKKSQSHKPVRKF